MIVIQHNTNTATTGEKFKYRPAGFAISTDVHHFPDRNNSKNCDQTTMINMSVGRGLMRKESDNQSSNNDSKTAADAFTVLRGQDQMFSRTGWEDIQQINLQRTSTSHGTHRGRERCRGYIIHWLHFRLLQVNSSGSTKRGKLFECVSEPLSDNNGVERQRFTHVWPGICVPEAPNGTSIGVQPLH